MVPARRRRPSTEWTSDSRTAQGLKGGKSRSIAGSATAGQHEDAVGLSLAQSLAMPDRFRIVRKSQAVIWASQIPEWTWGGDASLIDATGDIVVVHTRGRTLRRHVYIQAHYHVFRVANTLRNGWLEVEHLVSFPVRRFVDGGSDASSVPWRPASGPHDSAPANIVGNGRRRSSGAR
jgi:hypothetical protein